jgi:nitrogen fixation protein NifU and related proteins
MTLDYSDKVKELFLHPKNMGEIKDANGIGKVGNPVCGDVMVIYIKVEKKNGSEIIKNIKFKAFGCAAAIATSSMITELAKGKTIEEANKIGLRDVAESLGGLPNIKMHCSSMAEKALKEAIKDYKKKKSSNNV